MEKVASTVMFPCKYSSGGCIISLLHTEKVRGNFSIVESVFISVYKIFVCPD
jgi:hypothetical protein